MVVVAMVVVAMVVIRMVVVVMVVIVSLQNKLKGFFHSHKPILAHFQIVAPLSQSNYTLDGYCPAIR